MTAGTLITPDIAIWPLFVTRLMISEGFVTSTLSASLSASGTFCLRTPLWKWHHVLQAARQAVLLAHPVLHSVLHSRSVCFESDVARVTESAAVCLSAGGVSAGGVSALQAVYSRQGLVLGPRYKVVFLILVQDVLDHNVRNGTI